MVVALDIETSAGGHASFEYWRRDFKVDSLSCAWLVDGQLQHWYSADSLKIAQKVAALSRANTPIVVHNLDFELNVLTKLYPKSPLNYAGDTMRLAQLYDGGGSEAFEAEIALTNDQMISMELGEIDEDDVKAAQNKSKGLSLEACSLRFLPEYYHNHKAVAHSWLTANHGIRSGFGRHLHLLPPDVLEAYNNKDTEITLALYTHLTTLLSEFDWAKDWKLYMLRVRYMGNAYNRGVRVDRVRLLECIQAIESELTEIERLFRETMAPALVNVADIRLARLNDEWVCDPSLKADRSRIKRLGEVVNGNCDSDWANFNISSSHHLRILFCDALKMVPKFLTKKGAPSFKATHLPQWGEGGILLQKFRKRTIVLQQAVNVYIASGVDGRVHAKVRPAGTRTGRVAGGGGGL